MVQFAQKFAKCSLKSVCAAKLFPKQNLLKNSKFSLKNITKKFFVPNKLIKKGSPCSLLKKITHCAVVVKPEATMDSCWKSGPSTGLSTTLLLLLLLLTTTLMMSLLAISSKESLLALFRNVKTSEVEQVNDDDEVVDDDDDEEDDFDEQTDVGDKVDREKVGDSHALFLFLGKVPGPAVNGGPMGPIIYW